MNSYGFNQKRYKHEQGMKVAPCNEEMEMDFSKVLNPPSSVNEKPERYGQVT
jgi:hypothetical protein